AENCGRSPHVLECLLCGNGGEQERQDESRGRAPWPRAEPGELFAGAVLFDSHACTGRTQESAAHLQLPAVVGATPEDTGAPGLQGRFDGLEPVLGTLPPLT